MRLFRGQGYTPQRPSEEIFQEAQRQVADVILERFVGVNIVGRTIRAVYSEDPKRFHPSPPYAWRLSSGRAIIAFDDGTWTQLLAGGGVLAGEDQIIADLPGDDFTRCFFPQSDGSFNPSAQQKWLVDLGIVDMERLREAAVRERDLRKEYSAALDRERYEALKARFEP